MKGFALGLANCTQEWPLNSPYSSAIEETPVLQTRLKVIAKFIYSYQVPSIWH